MLLFEKTKREFSTETAASTILWNKMVEAKSKHLVVLIFYILFHLHFVKQNGHVSKMLVKCKSNVRNLEIVLLTFDFVKCTKHLLLYILATFCFTKCTKQNVSAKLGLCKKIEDFIKFYKTNTEILVFLPSHNITI